MLEENKSGDKKKPFNKIPKPPGRDSTFHGYMPSYSC